MEVNLKSLRTRLITTVCILFSLLFSNPLMAYDLDAPITDINSMDEATLASVNNGKKLFRSNCASCHAVNAQLTGPALAGSWENWESKEKMYSWIRNSQEMIKSGDPYANQIYAEYNNSVMTSFPALQDEQIDDIVNYIQAAAQGWPPKVVDGGADPGTETSTINNNLLYLLLGFLLAVLLLLWNVTGKLNKIVMAKEGDEIPEDRPLLSRLLSRKTFSVLLLIGAIALIANIGSGAVNLGRSQGYMPEQPIKFSHELHAGQNGIQCQYCHSGAEESRHAVIPTVNVCMNCHKAVKEGPKYGTEEIAKIYEHSGWDPDEGKYTAEARPIEWVKIHNLPDHVYFNHAQHVNVGGIECQTCHGNIEEMEVVQQFAPLSMGWCINCHRETEIQFSSNEYYSIFERYHDDIKNGKRSGVTVEDIGGTECQKCHY